MRRKNKEVVSILRDIIGKRIQAMKQGESTRDDLLGLLLETNMKDTDGDNSQSTGMGMTIQDVIEECKVFYFAGMETTSVLLTWTMVVLSMHPEWQDRAREEVIGLFGQNKPGRVRRPKPPQNREYFFRSLVLFPAGCYHAKG